MDGKADIWFSLRLLPNQGNETQALRPHVDACHLHVVVRHDNMGKLRIQRRSHPDYCQYGLCFRECMCRGFNCRVLTEPSVQSESIAPVSPLGLLCRGILRRYIFVNPNIASILKQSCHSRTESKDASELKLLP